MLVAAPEPAAETLPRRFRDASETCPRRVRHIPPCGGRQLLCEHIPPQKRSNRTLSLSC